MSGFTDIHAHFLYGLDDGARPRKDMEDMLDAAHADGISVLFATPHRTPGVVPFDEEACARHLQEARAYCREKGYALEIHHGAEVMYTPALQRYAEERLLPTLGDSNKVLVEFIPDVPFAELESAVGLLDRCGYIPVLAHIERYACLGVFNARRLKQRYNVRYQINCGSILSGRGFFWNWRIRRWLRDGIIDFVATDAHNCHSRPFRMSAAYAVLQREYGELRAVQWTGEPLT